MVSSVDSSRICALVVGINAYEDLPPLQNGVGDAQAVEKELREIGVERIISASDCTYEQLIDNTNQYLSKLRKGDVALVYVAAHAAMYQNQNIVLTTTSNKRNLADTSLRVQLLLIRFATCRVECTRPDAICIPSPPNAFKR